jgi:hypothetical protein
MRRWMWSAVVLAGLGLAACKSETPVVARSAPLESEGVLGGPDLRRLQGTVTAVSKTQFIVRDAEGKERPLEIDDETGFFHRGQAVERVQLQEGKQVRASYDEREGEWVADTVEID